MKVIFPLTLLAILSACATYTTVTSYQVEGEYDSWVHLDKDTIKDIGFYISNTGLPMAGSILYQEFKELSTYKEITLTLEGSELNIIREDSMIFEIGEQNGSYDYREYFTGKNLSSVMPQIMKVKGSGLYSLSCKQSYSGFLNPLPEKLVLKFQVVTKDTIVSGTLPFVKKVETKKDEVTLRWH